MTKRNGPIRETRTRLWKDKNFDLHRVDGPAYEENTGHKAWYVHGASHRIDGPAYEYGDIRFCFWYVRGIFLDYDSEDIIIARKTRCEHERAIR